MPLSSSAKADDPAFQRRQQCDREIAAYWIARTSRAMTPSSPVIRKYLDRVVEAAHRMFADVFEIEIVLDEIGERA